MSNPYVIALDATSYKSIGRVFRKTANAVSKKIEHVRELAALTNQSVISADKFQGVHVTGFVDTNHNLQRRRLAFFGTITTNPDKDNNVNVHVDHLTTPGYDPIRPGNSVPRTEVDLVSIDDIRQTVEHGFVIQSQINRLKWDDHFNTILVAGTGERKPVRSSHADYLSIKPDNKTIKPTVAFHQNGRR